MKLQLRNSKPSKDSSASEVKYILRTLTHMKAHANATRKRATADARWASQALTALSRLVKKHRVLRVMLLTLAVSTVVGCADPAFQQYIVDRQAAINGMPNGANKYVAQERLDQQILADKQRQNQQAANAGAAIAAGVAAGANAYNASRPVYVPVVYPYYHPYHPYYGW